MGGHWTCKCHGNIMDRSWKCCYGWTPDSGHGNIIWMVQWTWTWMVAFNTSSLVLYLARVQSEPHLIVFRDCDDRWTWGVLGVSIEWCHMSLMHGVWCLVFDVWCLMSSVWCLVSDVWCLVMYESVKKGTFPILLPRRFSQALLGTLVSPCVNDTGSCNSNDVNGEKILWPHTLSHCAWEYFGRRLIWKFCKFRKRGRLRANRRNNFTQNLTFALPVISSGTSLLRQQKK